MIGARCGHGSYFRHYVYVRPDLNSTQTLRTYTGYQELFLQGDNSPQSGTGLQNARSSNYVQLYEVYCLILRDVSRRQFNDEWG